MLSDNGNHCYRRNKSLTGSSMGKTTLGREAVVGLVGLSTNLMKDCRVRDQINSGAAEVLS
jgi:hypothetical protein